MTSATGLRSNAIGYRVRSGGIDSFVAGSNSVVVGASSKAIGDGNNILHGGCNVLASDFTSTASNQNVVGDDNTVTGPSDKMSLFGSGNVIQTTIHKLNIVGSDNTFVSPQTGTGIVGVCNNLNIDYTGSSVGGVPPADMIYFGDMTGVNTYNERNEYNNYVAYGVTSINPPVSSLAGYIRVILNDGMKYVPVYNPTPPVFWMLNQNENLDSGKEPAYAHGAIGTPSSVWGPSLFSPQALTSAPRNTNSLFTNIFVGPDPNNSNTPPSGTNPVITYPNFWKTYDNSFIDTPEGGAGIWRQTDSKIVSKGYEPVSSTVYSGSVESGGIVSTTVTGTNTLFQTELNNNDIVIINGIAVTIVSISSQTEMVINIPIPDVPPGTSSSIVSGGTPYLGFCTINNGDTVVTGSGTDFTSSLTVETKVSLGTEVFTVSEIISDTEFHTEESASSTTVGKPIFFPALPSVTSSQESTIHVYDGEFSLARKVESMNSGTCVLEFYAGIDLKMTQFMVCGSPYFTFLYQSGSIPTLKTTFPIQTINGINYTGPVTRDPITASSFRLTLDNGEIWKVYCLTDQNNPVPVNMTMNLNSTGILDTLTSSANLGTNMFLQICMIENPGIEEATYDARSSSIVYHMDIEMEWDGSNTTLTHVYTHRGTSPMFFIIPGKKTLIQPPPTTLPPLATTFLGNMESVSGHTLSLATKTIKYVYQGNASFWNGNPWLGNTAYPPAYYSILDSNIATDVTEAAPNPAVMTSSPYFGGKQIARYSLLALLADFRGLTAEKNTILTSVKSYLDSWFDETNANPLVYETNYGGIITNGGLTNSGADFGNGWYNDHHFHYGYWIYACAVVMKLDPSWFLTIPTRLEKALYWVRDVINPSKLDPHFTQFRHFNFFEMRSNAAGLFQFGDDRNQESSSEAINCYYACFLFGLAYNNASPNTDSNNILNIGRALCNMEMSSAILYYQYLPSYYKLPFGNQTMNALNVGVLWSSKADYSNFFLAREYATLGIQFIPVTPISRYFINMAWVANNQTRIGKIIESSDKEGTTLADTGKKWLSILLNVMTRYDQAGALLLANTLTTPQMDDGLSKSNLIYTILTSQ